MRHILFGIMIASHGASDSVHMSAQGLQKKKDSAVLRMYVWEGGRHGRNLWLCSGQHKRTEGGQAIAGFKGSGGSRGAYFFG